MLWVFHFKCFAKKDVSITAVSGSVLTVGHESKGMFAIRPRSRVNPKTVGLVSQVMLSIMTLKIVCFGTDCTLGGAVTHIYI